MVERIQPKFGIMFSLKVLFYCLLVMAFASGCSTTEGPDELKLHSLLTELEVNLGLDLTNDSIPESINLTTLDRLELINKKVTTRKNEITKHAFIGSQLNEIEMGENYRASLVLAVDDLGTPPKAFLTFNGIDDTLSLMNQSRAFDISIQPTDTGINTYRGYILYRDVKYPFLGSFVVR